MLSESIRHHDIKASPSEYFVLNEIYETLPDQLSSLASKYDTLQQTNKTLLLENDQYKHHISELDLQIVDLNQELSQHKKDFEEELTLKPMLTEHISVIQQNAEEDAQEIEELRSTINKQSQTMKELKIENTNIKEQYEKCLIALETNKKQIKIHKQINSSNSTRDINIIQSLQNENELLKQELNQIKLFYNTHKYIHSPTATVATPTHNNNTPVPIIINHTPMSTDTFTPIPLNPLPETQLHMPTKTFSFNTDMPIFTMSRKRTCTTESVTENMGDIGMQIFQPNSYLNFSEFGGGFSENNSGEMIERYLEKIEVLTQRIERLEFDNEQLKCKIKDLENDEDEKCKQIVAENDKRESIEMEQLFEKCVDGIKVDNLIEKYRLLKWEIQLREVIQ